MAHPRPNPSPAHRIAETRDWARFILAAGIAGALLIEAASGSLDPTALAALVRGLF